MSNPTFRPASSVRTRGPSLPSPWASRRSGASRLSPAFALALATTFIAVAATACVDESPGTRVEVRSLEEAGIHWTISGLDASIDHAEIEAIAKFVETRTKPDGVMVRMMKSDEGDATLMITLAGEKVQDDGLEAAVREQFPGLSSAKFARTTGAAPNAGPLPVPPSLPDLTWIEKENDATPEDVESEIRDALSAHGVEGEVDVKVSGDGERREVRVEVRQEATADAPAPAK